MEPPKQQVMEAKSEQSLLLNDETNSDRLCTICLSNIPDYRLKDCQHQFCIHCLEQHTRYAFDQNLIPIVCPARHCGRDIQDSDLQKLMDRRQFEKMKRHIYLRENANVRECACGELNEWTGSNSDNPIIECQRCFFKYCLYHGNAHPLEQTCSDYEDPKRASPEEILSREALSNLRGCPKCKRKIEVITGTCNFVKCPAPCGCKFCYGCGSADFSGKMNPTCRGCGARKQNEKNSPELTTDSSLPISSIKKKGRKRKERKKNLKHTFTITISHLFSFLLNSQPKPFNFFFSNFYKTTKKKKRIHGS